MQVYDQENQKQEQKVISHLKKKKKNKGWWGIHFHKIWNPDKEKSLTTGKEQEAWT